jgi:hypothetical protein
MVGGSRAAWLNGYRDGHGHERIPEEGDYVADSIAERNIWLLPFCPAAIFAAAARYLN